MDAVRGSEMVDGEWCSADKGTIVRNCDDNCDWNGNDVDVWMQMEQWRCGGTSIQVLQYSEYTTK